MQEMNVREPDEALAHHGMDRSYAQGMADARPHVVVLGLMGVGKSTTAQAVAQARAVPCFDSDQDIQALFGQTGRAIAEQTDVDALHTIEAAVLIGRLASPHPSIVSAAASVVEDSQCCSLLTARASVVVLEAPIDELERRIATGAHRRAIPRAELDALASQRATLFAAVADFTLDARRSTEDLVDAIVNRLP